MTKNTGKSNGKPQHDTSRIDALLAAVSDELIGDDLGQVTEATGLRVEQIPLDLIRPDPVQPRRMLPDRIHHAFHNQQLTPMQSLRELVQRTQVVARQHGRPFNQVVEVLDVVDGDIPAAKLTPEENQLKDLVTLALTIRDDGQVNPLTVVDVSQGVATLFRIETGERRYWASWLLRDFVSGYKGDSNVPCIVVPREVASPFRQAKENTARSGLSAIAMARQAALLLLTAHDFEIPTYAVTNDFYRQALELDLRGKRDRTQHVLSAMGGISSVHFHRFKALLRLSDEAMELADRNQVEEKKLRHVTNLQQEYQAEMVRQIIDFNLTSRQIEELCIGADSNADTQEAQQQQKYARRLVRLLRQKEHFSPEQLAETLVEEEGSNILAQARLSLLTKLISDTEDFLKHWDKQR